MKERAMKKPVSYEIKKRRVGLCFLIPWMIGTVFFFIRPVISALLYSIGQIDFNLFLGVKIIGAEHYHYALFGDTQFVQKLVKVIPPMLYQVPIVVIFSLFLAILINQKFVGRTFFRAVFFLPIIIASGIILNIMNGDAVSQLMMAETESSKLLESEMLSIMLRDMSVSKNLVSEITRLVDNLLRLMWKSGLQTLLFLAALQTVPASMYEAARIEGGTAWENFWKITFPMVSPTILINIVYSIIDSFNDYSNEVVLYIQEFTRAANYEYSAALTWVYTLITLLFVGGFYFVVNRFVYYEV